MNQSKPIKSKEEIYKEAWAKWANETFITDPPLKPEDCDNEHSWIYGAMEDYAKQFIQSGIKGWVKASERLPGNDSPQYLRLDGHEKRMGNFYEHEGKIKCYIPVIDSYSIDEHHFDKIEWLDETPIQSGEERLFTIKEALEIALINLTEAHNLLAKSSLCKEQYQPISLMLAKAKIELFKLRT